MAWILGEWPAELRQWNSLNESGKRCLYETFHESFHLIAQIDRDMVKNFDSKSNGSDSKSSKVSLPEKYFEFWI